MHLANLKALSYWFLINTVSFVRQFLELFIASHSIIDLTDCFVIRYRGINNQK